jgi:hypothetical protein
LGWLAARILIRNDDTTTELVGAVLLEFMPPSTEQSTGPNSEPIIEGSQDPKEGENGNRKNRIKFVIKPYVWMS